MNRRSPLQKHSKRRDNVGDDVVVDVDQALDCVFTVHDASASERYLNNREELHVHFLAPINRLRIVSNYYCLVFNKSSVHLEARGDKRHISASAGYESSAARMKKGDWQQTMFVDVRQIVQLPEGMRCVIIPSVVRLQTLDDCLGRWVYPTNLRDTGAIEHMPSRAEIPLPILIPEDGELGLLRYILRERDRVLRGEGISEMVKCAPEPMENLADHKGEGVDRHRTKNRNFDDEAVGLATVWLREGSASFAAHPGSKLNLQVFQLCSRPYKLEQVSVVHGRGADSL